MDEDIKEDASSQQEKESTAALVDGSEEDDAPVREHYVYFLSRMVYFNVRLDERVKPR